MSQETIEKVVEEVFKKLKIPKGESCEFEEACRYITYMAYFLRKGDYSKVKTIINNFKRFLDDRFTSIHMVVARNVLVDARELLKYGIKSHMVVPSEVIVSLAVMSHVDAMKLIADIFEIVIKFLEREERKK